MIEVGAELRGHFAQEFLARAIKGVFSKKIEFNAAAGERWHDGFKHSVA